MALITAIYLLTMYDLLSRLSPKSSYQLKIALIFSLFSLFFFFKVTPASASFQYYTFDARPYFMNRMPYSNGTISYQSPPPGKTFESLKTDYDTLAFLTSLQGIVNRNRPDLFLIHDDVDLVWLNNVASNNIWLTQSTSVPLNNLDEVINKFKDSHGLTGSVVWQEDKPYTLNLARTIAGVENLVIVRQSSPLYSQITSNFPVKVDLTTQNFTSKQNAYYWLKDNYLGRVNPIIGFFKDGYPLTLINQGRMFDLDSTGQVLAEGWGLMMSDYLVSQKAFVVDLSPNANIIPRDEPTQPLGQDRQTLEGIIDGMRQKVGNDKLLTFWGYTNLKYSNTGTCQNDVDCLENVLVRLIADKGGALRLGGGDTFALDAPNFSFWHHGPGTDSIPQNPSLAPKQLLQRGYVLGYPLNFSFEQDASSWTFETTNRSFYNESYNATHGSYFLETNNSPENHGKSFYQNIPLTLWRGYRYRFAINARVPRLPQGQTAIGTQAVWAWKADGSNALLCANDFSINNQSWRELDCDFQLKDDGFNRIKIEVYLKSDNYSYDFDEAYLLGPNTLTQVNPNQKFLLHYIGDMDFAMSAYDVPFKDYLGYDWYPNDPRTGTWYDPIWSYRNYDRIPRGWGLSATINKEIPPVFSMLTKSKNNGDWFVMPDSGAGYTHPGNLPDSVVPAWIKETTNLQRQFGYKSGWVLQAFDAVTDLPGDTDKGRKIRSMYNIIAPEGIYYEADPNAASDRYENGFSVLPMGYASWQGYNEDQVRSSMNILGYNRQFIVYRHTFISPLLLDVVYYQDGEGLKYSLPSLELVDPNTFFYLYRLSKGDPTFARFTPVSQNLPTFMIKGQTYNVSLTVRNDGWDIWVPKGNYDCDGSNQAGAGCHALAYGLNPGAINPAGRGKAPYDVPGGASYPSRADLSSLVYPGGSATFNFTLTAPQTTGKYSFQADLIKELAYFAESQGNVPWQKIIYVLEANGDLNNDGLVNFEDIDGVLAQYNTSGSIDFNLDGKVNASDYAQVLKIKNSIQD